MGKRAMRPRSIAITREQDSCLHYLGSPIWFEYPLKKNMRLRFFTDRAHGEGNARDSDERCERDDKTLVPREALAY